MYEWKSSTILSTPLTIKLNYTFLSTKRIESLLIFVNTIKYISQIDDKTTLYFKDGGSCDVNESVDDIMNVLQPKGVESVRP